MTTRTGHDYAGEIERRIRRGAKEQAMNYLRPDHVHEIERILSAPLSPELLTPVTWPDDLSPAALETVRKIARESRPLAVAYLRQVVPSERLSALVSFLEQVFQGK